MLLLREDFLDFLVFLLSSLFLLNMKDSLCWEISLAFLSSVFGDDRGNSSFSLVIGLIWFSVNFSANSLADILESSSCDVLFFGGRPLFLFFSSQTSDPLLSSSIWRSSSLQSVDFDLTGLPRFLPPTL